MIACSHSSALRPPKAGERPNGHRRLCGDPSRQVPAPALKDVVHQHFAKLV